MKAYLTHNPHCLIWYRTEDLLALYQNVSNSPVLPEEPLYVLLSGPGRYSSKIDPGSHPDFPFNWNKKLICFCCRAAPAPPAFSVCMLVQYKMSVWGPGFGLDQSQCRLYHFYVLSKVNIFLTRCWINCIIELYHQMFDNVLLSELLVV